MARSSSLAFCETTRPQYNLHAEDEGLYVVGGWLLNVLQAKHTSEPQ